MFCRNNRIWRKDLFFKASSVASHQTRWYNKKRIRKGYSVPRTFHRLKITNCIITNKRCARYSCFYFQIPQALCVDVSKVKTKISAWCLWSRSSVFIVDFVELSGSVSWMKFFYFHLWICFCLREKFKFLPKKYSKCVGKHIWDSHFSVDFRCTTKDFQ